MPDRSVAPVDGAALEAVLDLGAAGRMLPAEAYTSDAVLAWERRHLFADSWVCAGRSADLAHGGDRRAVRVGDDSVVVIRGDDYRLRAFYNVCRHRGHQLQPEGTTVRRRALQCPYHAWTYGLDGALRFTPRFDAEVARWDPGRLVAAATHTYEVAANWKLAVENYHECFHCPVIHPELCRLTPPSSEANAAGHAGLWIGGWMTLADGAATMSKDGRSLGVGLPGLDEVWRRRIHYVGLVPNLLISLHPDYVMTHRLKPVAPDRTLVEGQWLFDPAALTSPGFDPAYAAEFWDVTNRQDWTVCEGVQRGVASRGFRPGPLAENEDAVTQFIRLVAQTYSAGGLPSAIPFADDDR